MTPRKNSDAMDFIMAIGRDIVVMILSLISKILSSAQPKKEDYPTVEDTLKSHGN